MHGVVGITAVTTSKAVAGVTAFYGVPAVEYICVKDYREALILTNLYSV